LGAIVTQPTESVHVYADADGPQAAKIMLAIINSDAKGNNRFVIFLLQEIDKID
jgi:hypothetical protein